MSNRNDWYGDIVEVRLGPPGHGGFCVARHEGRVLFVRHGLPGELVRAQITEDRGGSFCRADAIEILDSAPDRIPATCPVSGPGGAGCCDFSFATPEAQRALKATVVADQLRRIAGWEPEFTVESIPLPQGVAHGVLARPDARPAASSPSRIGGVATHLSGLLLAGDATSLAEQEDSASTGKSGAGESEDSPSRSAGSSAGQSGSAGSVAGRPSSARSPGSRPGSAGAQSNSRSAGAPGRIGGVVTSLPGSRAAGGPVAVSPDPRSGGWRSRVRLVVDADGRAGVHRYRSTEVIADLRCPQPMAGALEGIAERKWTPGAELVVAVDADGIRHLVEIEPPAADSTDRRGGQGRERRAGGRGGAPRGDRRGGDRGSAAARRAAAHSARAERVVDGSGRAVQYVAGRRWELSATGFWQPHYGAAQCYSDVVADWAGAGSGALTWDLYSGVGVFAARLADQVGPEGAVHAVEFARTAVTEAKANLRDLPWVDSRAERVERWIVDQPATAPDVVVLDPPRAGAGKQVVAALTERAPRRIIHIGCDPASFARDISLYQSAGYRPVGLRVFDAFPGTHHVECVAVLER